MASDRESEWTIESSTDSSARINICSLRVSNQPHLGTVGEIFSKVSAKGKNKTHNTIL